MDASDDSPLEIDIGALLGGLEPRAVARLRAEADRRGVPLEELILDILAEWAGTRERDG